MTGAGRSLEIRGLDVTLDDRPVLSSVSLTVPGGSWLAVIGPNGAGKSTLLRAVAGLLPHGGDVLIGGTPARSLRPRQRARLMAYAPQDPILPPDMTVFDYTLLGRSPYIPYLSRDSAHDREVAGGVLERLDLEALAARPLGRLSGGERQRVVLARALAQQTPVLLLDEPTTALDLGHQQQVLELVDRLRLADGLTVVMILHDLSLAGQYADTLTLLADGRVAACGSAAAVLTAETVAEHFDARVRVSRDLAGRPVLSLIRPDGGTADQGDGDRGEDVGGDGVGGEDVGGDGDRGDGDGADGGDERPAAVGRSQNTGETGT